MTLGILGLIIIASYLLCIELPAAIMHDRATKDQP